jgi:hypothetical protein
MAIFAQEYRIVLGYSDPQPICDVSIFGRDRRVLVEAIIDSGAARPIFHRSSAEDAGIDLSNALRFPIQYGGSKTDGRIARVRVRLGADGPQIDTSVVFVDHLELPYGLLGRIGIFDRFNEIAFLHKLRNPRVEFRK